MDLNLVSVRHLVGNQNSPHALLHRAFHNHWGQKRVGLLWGAWVLEASRLTAKEELS